ncbi:MAG: hypothetical protein HY049_17555 [Acidobacteria bacterium]|nr:hypothetical protein [Acidobacteriota bacterium]
MNPPTGSERHHGGQIPLILGPDTAPVDRRTPVLLWGLATIILGVAVAYLLTQGEIRTIVLILLGVLGLLCLSPRRGIFIILLFLPFMYYLRRQVLYFNDFSKTDPILIFPPLVAIAMFTGILLFQGNRCYRYFQSSLLMKLLVSLGGVYFLEMFNPLQGNILVGVAGAMYFIVPMLWVFMGFTLDRRGIHKVFLLIIVVGTVTTAYGVYQHYFGLTAVEKYELESKNFLLTFGEKVRVMSTFSTVGDFSLYMVVTAFLAAAHYWRNKARPLYLIPVGMVLFTLVFVAVRTAVFMLAFSLIMFLIIYVRERRLVVLRASMAFIGIGLIYSQLYSFTPEQVWQGAGRSNDPFVVHTISGIAHPTEEKSFTMRLANWSYIVRSSFTEFPVGRGLGSTTIAARRFAGGKGTEADSMFFELMYGSSPLAAFIFVGVGFVFFRDILTLASKSADPFTYRVVFGVLAAFFLGSLFGQCLRDSVSAPFAWLLIGWTIRETVERDGQAEIEAPASA